MRIGRSIHRQNFKALKDHFVLCKHISVVGSSETLKRELIVSSVSCQKQIFHNFSYIRNHFILPVKSLNHKVIIDL